MQHQGTIFRSEGVFPQAARYITATAFGRHLVIGVLLAVSLLAFEIFNFDTTQYALENLLGDVRFVNVRWATILAFAFCAIDFAGLAHMFTPERGRSEPREVWYLMGAWLLGATMNALMTWWAINLTLLNHQFGNEVLSRRQLLEFVPIFVAVLVWLTRILFIGAISLAGDHLFQATRPDRRPAVPAQVLPARQATRRPTARPVAERRQTRRDKRHATRTDRSPLVRRPPLTEEPEPAPRRVGPPQAIRPGPMPASVHASPRRRR